jgi:hypothetical protein
MNIIMGTILGGTMIASIISYVITVVMLSLKAYKGHLKSDSRGIKNLKFQEWNHAYIKFVLG